jgi:hypothetical protein
VLALARSSALVFSVVFANAAGAQDSPSQEAPSLARASALIEDADFEAARAVLTELAAGEGFSERDVLVWLALSALVEFALTGTPPEDELGALLAFDPAHSLGESVPPDLRDALDDLRDREHPPVEIAVEATSSRGRYRLRAAVANDGAGIVREPRVYARAGGEREWRASEGGVLTLDTAADEIAYYAEAVGPGGAIIARQGSADAPLVLRSTTRAERVVEPPPIVGDGVDDGGFPTGAVIGISVGAAVAIGVAVVLALVLPVSPASPLEPPSFELEL